MVFIGYSYNKTSEHEVGVNMGVNMYIYNHMYIYIYIYEFDSLRAPWNKNMVGFSKHKRTHLFDTRPRMN